MKTERRIWGFCLFVCYLKINFEQTYCMTITDNIAASHAFICLLFRTCKIICLRHQNLFSFIHKLINRKEGVDFFIIATFLFLTYMFYCSFVNIIFVNLSIITIIIVSLVLWNLYLFLPLDGTEKPYNFSYFPVTQMHTNLFRIKAWKQSRTGTYQVRGGYLEHSNCYLL